jgi:phospholipase/carboxylesterase
LLESISIYPDDGNAPSTLLVALHGWGANFNDLAGLVHKINLSGYHFMFPNAPFSYPHSPDGRAWYNLQDPNLGGIIESRQLLTHWLLSLEETTGIPLHRTVMLGFSQGGAMTLDVGLTLPLGALCSISGFLHNQPSKGNQSPTLMIHGQQDDVVPLSEAHRAKDELEKLGIPVTYREFKDMGHDIPLEAIAAIGEFLKGLTF